MTTATVTDARDERIEKLEKRIKKFEKLIEDPEAVTAQPARLAPREAGDRRELPLPPPARRGHHRDGRGRRGCREGEAVSLKVSQRSCGASRC